jgi:SM-20-related protein
MIVRQGAEATQTRETVATMETPQQSEIKPASRAAPQTAELEIRLAEAVRQLTVARAEIATRDAQITEIRASVSWKVTALLRRAGRAIGQRKRRVLNMALIRNHRLETYPYSWAAVNCLFDPDDASELSATYPCDHFKLVSSLDGEKEYEYEARSLIAMGAGSVTYPEELSKVWHRLASDLLSSEYRAAMSALTGRDLSQAPLEVNVFHYGPGDSLGAHKDLAEKIVTHVLYFNESWDGANGGCLRILRSKDVTDVAAEIPPLIGYSSVLVRSDKSWHAVSRVARNSPSSRRSVTVTFYRPGAISTMWPPGDTTSLHRYEQ